MNIRTLSASLLCLFVLSVSAFSQRLAVDTTFAPAINGPVHLLEVLSDGKILISGDFSLVNGVTRKEIARLNADGSLDGSFDANWLGGQFNQGMAITSMKVLADGKILVAGGLPYDNSTGGPSRVRRLNADGSPDASMTAAPSVRSNTLFNKIENVGQLANGKILVCGDFDLANNNARANLARYNNDGTYDASFTTTIDNDCLDVEPLPDGKYYVSGFYTTINGVASESLTRFNANDSIDTTFNAAPIPNTSDHTYYKYIDLQPDGKLIVYRATSVRYGAARLNTNGSLHTQFPVVFETPGKAAFQSNGKVLLAGEFDNVFGQSFDLNRYNADGSHDPSLPRMGFFGNDGGITMAAAFAADGGLLVGGDFNEVNLETGGPRTARPFLARLVPQAIPVKHKYDFDGDGKDDIAVYRPDNQVWYVNRSTAGFFATQFGIATDVPVVRDYDADGRADIGVFREGTWYWLRSSDWGFAYRICGGAGDIPTISDYNAYCLVFRPSEALFYSQVPYSAASSVEFRDMQMLGTDKPVVADYDGDGRDDLAVFRDGNWFYMASNNLQTRHYLFGIAGDKPVIGDFDGDLRTDFAVYRPSEGTWYIQRSAEGFAAVQWGLAEDIPVPADYDGDGKTDIAVYRPSSGVWYQIRSSNGGFHFEHFGLSGDIPVQAR